MTDDTIAIVPRERIERSILLVRSQKVLLDPHLAILYESTPKRSSGPSNATSTAFLLILCFSFRIKSLQT